MNRYDILCMAIKAGLYDRRTAKSIEPFLERFAALVAAAEREACAALCDAEADEFGGMSDGFYAAKNCAEAIRARDDA